MHGDAPSNFSLPLNRETRGESFLFELTAILADSLAVIVPDGPMGREDHIVHKTNLFCEPVRDEPLNAGQASHASRVVFCSQRLLSPVPADLEFLNLSPAGKSMRGHLPGHSMRKEVGQCPTTRQATLAMRSTPITFSSSVRDRALEWPWLVASPRAAIE